MDTLTFNQLTEILAALWEHYDIAHNSYIDKLQQLEVGSEDMTDELAKWEAKRNDINAALAAVNDEIKKREAEICPPTMRRGRKAHG